MPPHTSHRQSPPAAQRCDILLTGGTVVTVDDDRSIHPGGAVAVSGDRIVAVGSAADLAGWDADQVVDCTGRAVLPGLVDGHNHLFQGLAKGLGEGMSIVPWLCQFMWPYAIAMTREDAVAAARLAAAEALRAGTTTVIDNHYAPTDLTTTLEIADVIEDAGLRGAVARGVVGPRTRIAERRGQPPELFRYSAEDELAITREAIRHRPPGSRVEVWPAPLNLTYVDQDLVRATVELARAEGTRWHTHCCEGAKDPEGYLEEYGVRPVQWLAKEGLLDECATLAHAIWLDDRDIEQVAEAGAGIAHNPTSNAYLASGALRFGELAATGVPMALGTDGPSCGHRQDLFDCMKQAVFGQRLVTLDPEAMTAAQALDLATRQGARYAGIDAGVIEPGRLADLIVVDLGKPHLQPVHDVVATLVYSARGSDVEMTVVGGWIVYRDGACVLLDETEATERATRQAQSILDRGGLRALAARH